MKDEDVLDLLRRSGRVLYGKRWQVPLSRDLGISDRALRYWLNGTNAIPVGDVLPKLLTILQSRNENLILLISDINRKIHDQAQ